MRHLNYALAALALAVTAAPSGALVINNGLAPPNPANILDSTNASATQTVIVTNAGCTGALPPPGCAPVGAATTVAMVDGGEALVLAAEQDSRITMSGGAVSNDLLAEDFSNITMSGGTVGATAALSISTITMSGGTVIGDLAAADWSKITMSGGTVGGSFLTEGINQPEVTLTGGKIGGDLVASAQTLFYMSGGTVQGKLVSIGSASQLIIIGKDFAVDGVPVGYGLLAASSGTLTGTLASGDPIDNVFCQGSTCLAGSGGLIVLSQSAPEPSSALLLTSGLLALAVRRRRARGGSLG